MKTLTEGASAPDFELADQDGRQVRLSERLESGPVVLFFYPVALSGGCTKEACRFRDLGAQFERAGAQRLGISMDAVEKQKRFDEAHGLGYPLLSDPSGEVATAYGVRRRFVTPVKRATFVIDRDRTLRSVVTSELNMDVHAERALAALGAL